MTDNERLEAVKEGIPVKTTAHDNLIKRKIKTAVGFMENAGVSSDIIDSDEGIGCICVGVTDLWSQAPGEIKFSPAFIMICEQLAVRSIPEPEVS